MPNGKNSLEMDENRTQEFQKSNLLEQTLSEINQGIPGSINPPYEKPKYPVILIMGAPRSGTTLTLQWLSAMGLFAYPTNISARFYGNPYLGARIQQTLIDYDTENQIGLNSSFNFQSNLGRSNGALAPSEYWYFWRRFFSFGEIQVLPQHELDAIDTKEFLRGLAGLEAAFNKPIVLKGMMLNWHIPFLNKLLDKVIFLNVERESFYSAQSLLYAREKFFGTRKKWYSFKPPEYEVLKKYDPVIQVAGQVQYTKQAIQAGLKSIDESRYLNISYEKFCDDPSKVYSQLVKKLNAQKYIIKQPYMETSDFKNTNSISLPQKTVKQLHNALTQKTIETGS